jgi:hypothetical protein
MLPFIYEMINIDIQYFILLPPLMAVFVKSINERQDRGSQSNIFNVLQLLLSYLRHLSQIFYILVIDVVSAMRLCHLSYHVISHILVPANIISVTLICKCGNYQVYCHAKTYIIRVLYITSLFYYHPYDDMILSILRLVIVKKKKKTNCKLVLPHNSKILM